MIGTVVPGLVATTIATSASLSFTGRPLNSTMTSPGSMPALAAGRPVALAEERAVRVRQAERLRDLLRERIDGDFDADDAARDLADAKLRQQIADAC